MGQGGLEDLEGDQLDGRLAAQGLPHVPLTAAAEPLQQAVAAQPVSGRQRRPLAVRPSLAPDGPPREVPAGLRPARGPDQGRRLDDPGARRAGEGAVPSVRPRIIQQSPEEGPQLRVRGDDHWGLFRSIRDGIRPAPSRAGDGPTRGAPTPRGRPATRDRPGRTRRIARPPRQTAVRVPHSRLGHGPGPRPVTVCASIRSDEPAAAGRPQSRVNSTNPLRPWSGLLTSRRRPAYIRGTVRWDC